MNRRNVLIGLGTAAVGTGAAFGSGAFTQVQAERAVSVETQGDATGYIELNGDAFHSASTTDGDKLLIQLDGNTYGNATGVNKNATVGTGNFTNFALNSTGSPSLESSGGSFTIESNTNDEITVDISLEINSGDLAEITVVALHSGGAEVAGYADTNTGTSTIDISADLTDSDTIDIGVIIDTTDAVDNPTNPTITIIAEDTDTTA